MRAQPRAGGAGRGKREAHEWVAVLACRYNDDLARKRNDGEHEKQRARNRELVGLQEESARRQEAERRRVAEQIEAERRATEKYKARLELCGLACGLRCSGCGVSLHEDHTRVVRVLRASHKACSSVVVGVICCTGLVVDFV